MDRDELIRRLMVTFLDELQEHMRVFNRELLALEQGGLGASSAEPVKTLFRSAHSLKGAARSVGASELERICHDLEELLAAIRDGDRVLDADVFGLLFASVDKIQLAASRLGQNAPEASAARPIAGRAPASPAARAQESAPVAAAQTPLPPTPTASIAPPRAPSGPPPSPPQPPAARRGVRDDALNADAVRIPGRRLDTLLAQSGELLVARRRLELRRSDLAALQDLLARFRAEWRSADQALKRALRQRKPGGASPGPGHNGSNGHELAGAREGGTNADPLPKRVERVSELTREYLVRLERELERLALGFAEDGRSLARAATPLEEQIHQARLLPFIDACDGLQRSVRDLALAQQKDVELVLEGTETELDRSIIDRLRDPLLHLVRNAVDHGIEPPAERVAAGKTPRARITLSASLRAELVEVTVADDGRGIDLSAVRVQAERRGLPIANDGRELSRLIFEPGLSTASEVTQVSGRGVGLDVVKSSLEAIRGHVDVTSEAGVGTRFVLSLPLTLTTARVLLVTAGGETLAVPSTAVRKLVRVAIEELRSVEGREMLLLGAAPVPLVSLGHLLGLTPGASVTSAGKLSVVVLGVSDQLVAFSVDGLENEQEVVLKPLGRRIGRLPHVSAATTLSSGRIALVLKAPDLIRSALLAQSGAAFSAHLPKCVPIEKRRLILVDDSVTTRTLEKSILEAAGYEVVAAADGAVGFQLLQDQGADLLLSDVEMPNMDGFTLTRSVRATPRFERLPIVLLTGLESEADRARGLAAGADAYLEKSAFDQATLLETIRQLLPA